VTIVPGSERDPARHLAADGLPVVIGDRFHTPDKPEEKFVVDAIDGLFVYMKSDGWSSWPRVTKKWKFAAKGWVRVTEKQA
jgi:hypothetical protein